MSHQRASRSFSVPTSLSLSASSGASVPQATRVPSTPVGSQVIPQPTHTASAAPAHKAPGAIAPLPLNPAYPGLPPVQTSSAAASTAAVQRQGWTQGASYPQAQGTSTTTRPTLVASTDAPLVAHTPGGAPAASPSNAPTTSGRSRGGDGRNGVGIPGTAASTTAGEWQRRTESAQSESSETESSDDASTTMTPRSDVSESPRSHEEEEEEENPDEDESENDDESSLDPSPRVSSARL